MFTSMGVRIKGVLAWSNLNALVVIYKSISLTSGERDYTTGHRDAISERGPRSGKPEGSSGDQD